PSLERLPEVAEPSEPPPAVARGRQSRNRWTTQTRYRQVRALGPEVQQDSPSAWQNPSPARQWTERRPMVSARRLLLPTRKSRSRAGRRFAPPPASSLAAPGRRAPH